MQDSSISPKYSQVLATVQLSVSLLFKELICAPIDYGFLHKLRFSFTSRTLPHNSSRMSLDVIFQKPFQNKSIPTIIAAQVLPLLHDCKVPFVMFDGQIVNDMTIAHRLEIGWSSTTVFLKTKCLARCARTFENGEKSSIKASMVSKLSMIMVRSTRQFCGVIRSMLISGDSFSGEYGGSVKTVAQHIGHFFCFSSSQREMQWVTESALIL